jgi:hypothetical protein
MKDFTENEATDEAVLLFTRKMRRLHPGAFADIWQRLPDGAKDALLTSERRADQTRLDSIGRTWAKPPLADDDEFPMAVS